VAAWTGEVAVKEDQFFADAFYTLFIFVFKAGEAIVIKRLITNHNEIQDLVSKFLREMSLLHKIIKSAKV